MLIQENLIEFLIQSVYLIYARLIVYAIQVLATFILKIY